MASTPPAAPIPIALLGAGIFAREAHRPAIVPHILSGAVSIAVIWSRTHASAARLAALYAADLPSAAPPAVLSGTPALDALLAPPGDGPPPAVRVAAAVLAVPIAALAPLSARALAAGLHVFAEKPLAAGPADAAAAAAAYATRAPGQLYCVGENFRVEGTLLAAAAAVRDMGGPVSVELVAHCVMAPGSKYAQGWRVDGGNDEYGQLLDSVVHYVAGMRVVVGADVSRVAARTQRLTDHLPAVDTAHAVLEFDNGVAGVLVCTFAAKTFKWEQTVLCTNGRVTLKRAVVDGKYGYTMKTEWGDGRSPENDTFHVFDGVGVEFASFFDGIKSGTEDPRLSASAAFNDVAVIAAVAESGKNGQFVNVAKLP